MYLFCHLLCHLSTNGDGPVISINGGSVLPTLEATEDLQVVGLFLQGKTTTSGGEIVLHIGPLIKRSQACFKNLLFLKGQVSAHTGKTCKEMQQAPVSFSLTSLLPSSALSSESCHKY